jgi:hypothetical protein
MTTPTNPLLAHLLSTPPFILELHRDDCEDVACVRCVPSIGSPPRPAGEWDVPLATVEQDAAKQKLRDLLSPERFQWLAEHRQPAPVGERLEYRHWLHDEDPDSTVPAFRVDLTKKPAGGTA